MELLTRQIISEFEGDGNTKLEQYSTAGTPEYNRMVAEMSRRLGLTSLKFNTIDTLIWSIGLPKCRVCTHCFDGTGCCKRKIKE